MNQLTATEENKKFNAAGETLAQQAGCGVYDTDFMRKRFMEYVNSTFEACKELILKKNSDYTKLNSTDPFHNFKQDAIQLYLNNKGERAVDGITIGLLTRLNDKRRRRENLLLTQGQLVLDEKLEDTIKDEINYLCILLCHIAMNSVPQIYKPTEKDKAIEEAIDSLLKEKDYEINQVRKTLQNVVQKNELLMETLNRKDRTLESETELKDAVLSEVIKHDAEIKKAKRK